MVVEQEVIVMPMNGLVSRIIKFIKIIESFEVVCLKVCWELAEKSTFSDRTELSAT